MTHAALTIVLCAVVFQTCTQFTNAEIASCRKPSETGCGSVIDFTNPQFPGLIVHAYNFSDGEKKGTCSRANIQYSGELANCFQNNHLDNCICENAACSTCIKDKIKADRDSCCGLTKYPYYGNTYYLVDESKRKPTCCAAEGVDSNNDPITECYCAAGTEGCFNLCPEPLTARVVGGRPVESCGTGVVSFRNGNAGHVICNGIYAYNPNGLDSKGNPLGIQSMVFLPKSCLGIIDDMETGPIVTIGNTSFPFKKDETTRIKLANPFLDGLTFDKYTGPCLDKPVCTYDKDTMAASINKQKCYMLSYGPDSFDDQQLPVDSGNLNSLSVYPVGAIGKCTSMTMPAECFFPANVAASYCLSDNGAPVFCSLDTGEKVLYGSIGQVLACEPNQKLFPFLPIS